MIYCRIFKDFINKCKVIFLRSPYEPFSAHGIPGFNFPASYKFQVMCDKAFFKSFHGFIIIIDDDFIIPHLVNPVDPSFHLTKNEKH